MRRSALQRGGLIVRAMRPDDADRLVTFHERLSPETTYYRFFGVHPHLMPGEIERFTNVDHRDREALVAIEAGEIVAVARFDQMPGRRAEMAFVVRDDLQNQGVGHVLLDLLIARAREEGVEHLVAETLPNNWRMLAVFRAAGVPMRSEHRDGVVHVVLDLLDDVADDAMASRRASG